MCYAGGTPKIFRPAGGDKSKDGNTNRLKAVYESLNELNGTLKYVFENREKLLGGYDPQKVNDHLKIISGSLHEVATELKTVNENLAKLRTSGGIMSLVFSGGAESIINKLTNCLDDLHKNFQNLMVWLEKNAAEKIAAEEKKAKEKKKKDDEKTDGA